MSLTNYQGGGARIMATLASSIRTAASRVVDMPWHPLFFACVPSLVLFSKFRRFIPETQLTAPLVTSIVATLFLWAAISRMMRGTTAAALVVTPVVLVVGQFGAGLEVVSSMAERGSSQQVLLVVVGSLLLLFVACAWAITVRALIRRDRLRGATHVVNLVGLMWV